MFDWVNGSRLFARPGEAGVTGNIYVGLHEFTDMSFVLHALRASDLFVDVGANAGTYTVLASAAVGARTIAFEPIPQTFQRLVSNVRLNRIEDRVRARNIAIGKQRGRVAFTSNLDTVNHAATASDVATGIVEVDADTLDSELQNENPVVLKVDVEGFEALVLEGATKTLSKPSLCAVIMELNGSGARYEIDEWKVVETMRSNGFEVFAYDPFSRSLSRIEPRLPSAGNFIFLRHLDLVSERVRTAPLAEIVGMRF